MGALARRLALWAPAGKALGEMADGERPFDPPVGCDRAKGPEHEVAPVELGMRDIQRPRTPSPAAPQHEIEVEHARPPAAAAAAAEIALDGFETLQHLR